VERARRLPSLRVGLHVVLTEGAPVLPASDLSHLVDGRGMLRSDMAALGATLAFSRRARRQLAAEIGAQFEAFRDTGLTLDHCNAHKHFHLHPLVGRLLAEVGARFGLRAMRVPLEPTSVLRRIEPHTPILPALLTAPLALALPRRVAPRRRIRGFPPPACPRPRRARPSCDVVSATVPQVRAARDWRAEAPIRPGSDAHKTLFCRTLLDTFDPYRPAVIDWPQL